MVRSLEESQIVAIRQMRMGGCALRQIGEFAQLNWNRRIPGPTISRICSGELYPSADGPRLSPAQARKLADTRRRIANAGRRKLVAA